MNLDEVLASPGGVIALAEATRLYQVVLNRAPDPVGLQDTVRRLVDGDPLETLAAAMLASPEFAQHGGPPDQVLHHNAMGDADPPHHDTPSAALAAAMVRDPRTIARHPVLPTLFPDGLLLHDPDDYRVWLAAHPEPSPQPASMPSVTFILPTAQAPYAAVSATLDAILALDWPGIDIILPLRPDLRHLAAADPRIRLLSSWTRFGRTPTTQALARATGTFTALLTPGDRLDPSAAPAVAAALATADVVLTDEDGLDSTCRRVTPVFGDAWDPDRALATPRPGLLLARTALIRRAGGLPRDTTQWDLLLRLSRHTSRIAHVPALLLTRRTPQPPPDLHQAQVHLDATHKGARAEPHGTTIRAIYPLPRTPPRASIVIATRNRAELLAPCVDGILHRTDYPDIELVLVDNGSDDPAALALLDRLETHPRTRIIRHPGPFNWAALNNAGVAASTGPLTLLLNNDTEVIEPGWLRELASQALRPGIGAVGAKLLYPDRTIQHAGVVLGRDAYAIHMWCGSPGNAPGYFDSLVVTREVAAVTGACLALPRTVYDAVGGCDAANLPVTWNDIDLCLRIRAQGLRILWTPHARLLHHEQASRGSDATPENDARFHRERAWMLTRWGDTLTHDPFLNPNLLPSFTELRLASRLP